MNNIIACCYYMVITTCAVLSTYHEVRSNPELLLGELFLEYLLPLALAVVAGAFIIHEPIQENSDG